jgi:glycosyltransferase involved in cell wall biosynthesis
VTRDEPPSSRPFHILLIGPDWEITARFRTELILDMLAQGWTVSVAAGGKASEERAGLERLGVNCLSVPWSRNSINPIADLAAVWRLFWAMKHLSPDAALAFTVKPATFGLIAAWLAGVRRRVSMITGAGYALMEGREIKRRLVRGIVLFLYRLSLHRAHVVIFQNPDDEAEFHTLGLLPPKVARFRTNGSGVDLERFSVQALPQGPIRFVMVARLLTEKGVREFVGGARIVRERGSDAVFDLVGPLDTNPAAIAADEVREWQAEGVVNYLGFHNDVQPFLKAAHVFVLPSYREGTPRSALEALATGRPVLACDVPGSREVVIPGETGLLVQVRSATAVADGMTWFLENQDSLPKMAAAAAKEARRRFDVRAVNHQIMSALIVASDRPVHLAAAAGSSPV